MAKQDFEKHAKIVDWSPDQMLEIRLKEPEDFLKVMETLTRMGISARDENRLIQSVHILHKQGRYYLVHFKELFLLDEKVANLQEADVMRRNLVATLLADWGLVEIVGDPELKTAPMSWLKIIPHKEKANWKLEAKYTIGKVGKDKAKV
jgi:hypothetical protein